MFCYFKILAEHEREELQSTSDENSEQLTIDAEEKLPAVVEVQTQNTGKNVSVQFRSSRTAKGKFGFFTQ